MPNKTGNYCAFYVEEPFDECALGANATKDFVYYNLLRSWKGKESSFPFNDSHDKNYNVRDGSHWEKTLKPRLRERLRCSKNVILFLSVRTLNSRALREEIDYAINMLNLPLIVIYPDFATLDSMQKAGSLKQDVKDLWSNLPIFKNSMLKVPTLHIPLNKDVIIRALNNAHFVANTNKDANVYYYAK